MCDGRVAFESVRMGSEGVIEGGLAVLEARLDEAAVNVGGSEQGDTGVAMLVVVPMEEGLAVGAGIFDGAEPVGEVGSVFQGFELGFGEGIVVGDVGARVGLGDPEISEQRRDRPAGTSSRSRGRRGGSVGREGWRGFRRCAG